MHPHWAGEEDGHALSEEDRAVNSLKDEQRLAERWRILCDRCTYSGARKPPAPQSKKWTMDQWGRKEYQQIKPG